MPVVGLAAEKSLLLAVRDRLRSQVPYEADQCEIEYDELAPAIVGQTYVAIMPAGFAKGKYHDTSGGIADLVFSVDVLVVKRIGNVARDRRRDVFINNVGALNEELDKIFSVVDFNYDVMNLANAKVAAETAITTAKFHKPLLFAGIERRPRLAPAEIFGGAVDTKAGLMRVISFGGAQWKNYK